MQRIVCTCCATTTGQGRFIMHVYMLLSCNRRRSVRLEWVQLNGQVGVGAHHIIRHPCTASALCALMHHLCDCVRSACVRAHVCARAVAYAYTSCCTSPAARLPCLHGIWIGLARTVYLRCVYGIFGRVITKYTVMYGAYIRY